MSIELSESNCREYIKNFDNRHKEGTDFELHCLGVIESDDNYERRYKDTKSSMTNLLEGGESLTQAISINLLFKDRADLSFGFMKADLEGYLLKALLGATDTLKKHRPVLCLSIYHVFYELFLSKQHLSSILENYQFEFRHIQEVRSHFFELIIVAIPKELLEKSDL